MARLPDPEIAEISGTLLEGYKELQDCLFNVIGQAIRKRSKAEKREEGKEEKD